MTMTDLELIYVMIVSIFGTGAMFFIVSLIRSDYLKADVYSRLLRTSFAVARLEQDNMEIATKVIKTTDAYVQFGDLKYPIDRTKFRREHGVPVIHFHHAFIEAVNYARYNEVLAKTFIPANVLLQGETEINIPGDKKGEHMVKTVQYSTIIPGDKIRVIGLDANGNPTKENAWKLLDERKVTYRHVSTPEQFSAYITLKNAEAEAKAILLRIKQLDKVEKFILLILIGTAICVFAGIYNAYTLNGIQGKEKEIYDLVMSYNSTINGNHTIILGPGVR